MAVAAVAVIAVVAVNMTSTDRKPAASPSPAERGTACPALKDTFDQRAAGTADVFRKSAKVADQIAEDALQQNNTVFGAPERTAVELYLFVREQDPKQRSPRIDRLLEAAKRSCTTLGRW